MPVTKAVHWAFVRTAGLASIVLLTACVTETQRVAVAPEAFANAEQNISQARILLKDASRQFVLRKPVLRNDQLCGLTATKRSICIRTSALDKVYVTQTIGTDLPASIAAIPFLVVLPVSGAIMAVDAATVDSTELDDAARLNAYIDQRIAAGDIIEQ